MHRTFCCFLFSPILLFPDLHIIALSDSNWRRFACLYPVLNINEWNWRDSSLSACLHNF